MSKESAVKPQSGGPRLLTLTTPMVRNQRTLVRLSSQKVSSIWKRWDAVVTRITHYHQWAAHARIIGLVLLSMEGDADTWFTDLFQIAKDVTLVLLPASILTLKPAAFWSENFDNVLCLDDLDESYPFLGAAWNGSEEDAVALFAHLCRYHRLVDVNVTRAGYPLEVVQGICPSECWVITQYFRPPEAERREELLTCLRNNCAAAEVDRMVLLNETDLSAEWKGIPGAEKIHQSVIRKRLTYAHFLQFVHDEVPDNVMVILANADIYVKEEIGDSHPKDAHVTSPSALLDPRVKDGHAAAPSALLDLWKINMKDRMLALLRWDVTASGEAVIFGPRADSQDTWILLSDSVRAHTWPYATFDFPLGKPGCDNAFAAHMLRERFVLCNPALTFKTYHLHLSNVRNYTKRDAIRSDLYINLVPTYLIDTKQETVPHGSASLGTPISICNELVSFEVRSSSLSNEITYCTMLEKEGRYKWEPSVENHYFEPAIPVYRWSTAAVTTNGLVYDPYTIYTGKQAEEFPYWKGSTVDLFTSLYSRDRMLVIPFPDTSIFLNSDTYLLYYVSRCMRLMVDYPGSSIWVPLNMTDPITALNWKGLTCGRAVPFEERSACWAKEVIGFVPGSASLELGHEDIQTLRSRCPLWKSTAERKAVLIADEVLTEAWCTEWVKPWLQQQGWNVQVVSKAGYEEVVGASLFIVLGGPQTASKWSRAWALPPQATVVEFQQELALSGELQHLCHVADIQPWILLLSKGSLHDVQQQVLEQLMKWYKKNMV